jgi:Type II secretion system (T2SS), protein G
MRLMGILVLMAGLLVAFCGSGTAEQPKDKDDKAKVDVAKVQLAVLDKAVAAYRVKNDVFPESIQTLVDAKIIDAKAATDPWGKQYQYEVGGKRNDRKKPDIWTVTPAKETIGNWPAKKK